ncbi:carbon starvation CstA family protein [Clostridium estertheticum]|uniref:Carbon starvation protein CstA n=1 Tax=Clostridium estertheticum subsp. estertheticum TaxID=1552 RepID=A0A1J0GJY4_9CLOT|nr:carbon starvation protein A [Clostridium estertheticum]APC41635.1 carbon starvation protein CstA [Clostridium estertheticum subsp. estertheticum]MBX4267352.1 carbon starvation protein A [Clostridium estertheticum]MBX4272135.1 carbon starvation protein A [Clostridium estertheticum]MBZ9616488.1 carbon starvation protein A [Clostridium estertheticum subsp. laramiense]WAG72216.1 carbon starvation protein A [Clostridium estertheticum]
MNSIVLVIVAALVLIIAYRTYGAFIAAKVLVLNEKNKVPSEVHNDGRDFIPTNKWVLLGHHFAAIAGAGPLIGPVLAAQFGYLPGTLWILIGAVVGGGVHDMVVLFASVRHDGQSIAQLAKIYFGKKMGLVTSIAVLFILIITMAGLGIPVVNSLFNSPWGTFTVGFTIPVAMFIGIYMKYIRPGKIAEATVIGMALIMVGVVGGPFIQHTAFGQFLTFDAKQMSIILAVYGFFAAALPVWLLLLPRDYLSTYMKLGVIGALALGIIIVRPVLQMPAITQYVHGGGPIIPGKVFPFLFITIACGALSGFHALISSGTTPKLIKNEKDILPIGYGCMLIEAFIALMALIAASVLPTADYFAINSLPAVFDKLNMIPKELPMLSGMVGEQLAGRPGGSVSLAVGMSYVFYKIPGLTKLMAYWYHFCIMFEALFILTTIDAGTRIGRYLLQDLAASVYKPFAKKNSWGNIILFSALMSFSWGYLLYTGNVSTIWPLFGVANQTLAAIAFAIGTTFLIKNGKQKYMLITVLPLIFISVTTFTAAIENIFNNYIPQNKIVLAVMSTILVIMLAIILVESVKVWIVELKKNKDVMNKKEITE